MMFCVVDYKRAILAEFHLPDHKNSSIHLTTGIQERWGKRFFYNVKRICQMLDCVFQAMDRCLRGQLKVSGESNGFVISFTVDFCQGWHRRQALPG